MPKIYIICYKICYVYLIFKQSKSHLNALPAPLSLFAAASAINCDAFEKLAAGRAIRRQAAAAAYVTAPPVASSSYQCALLSFLALSLSLGMPGGAKRTKN